MTRFLFDLRQAIRSLSRDKTFAAAAILTLALGIGANTAIFSLIRAVLLQPLPLEESGRLVRVYESNPKRSALRNVVNPANFLAWEERATVVRGLAAYASRPYNLAGDGEPERVVTGIVTGDFFTTLGARPALGRLIQPSDGEPDAADVVVLADGLWRRRFAGDPKVVGREIKLEGRKVTIVGVAAPRSRCRPTPSSGPP